MSKCKLFKFAQLYLHSVLFQQSYFVCEKFPFVNLQYSVVKSLINYSAALKQTSKILSKSESLALLNVIETERREFFNVKH